MSHIFRLINSTMGLSKSILQSRQLRTKTRDILAPTFRSDNWFREEVQKWRQNHSYYKIFLLEQLEELFQQIRESPNVTRYPNLGDHVVKLIGYNLFDNKMLRGSQVLHMAKIAKRQEKPKKLDQVAGLIPEFIRVNFNIQLDFYTGRKLRYQKSTWPAIPDIGYIAANDILIVQWAMFQMAQNAFINEPWYHEMMQYAQNVTRLTAYAQFTDEYFARGKAEFVPNESKVDWNQFTEENWLKIVQNKTAIDAAPCKIALYLAGLKGTKYLEEADLIARKMGLLNTISADFVDAFFDPKTMSSDDENILPDDADGDSIRRGKLTFLAIKALKRAKGREKQTLLTHYGKDDDESVEKIKSLFKKLGLLEVYSQKQSEMAKELLQMIHEWDEKGSNVPKEVFPCLSSSIYANGANLSWT